MSNNYVWGVDIEQLVFWLPDSHEGIIYKASELRTGKSVVYVERKEGGRFAAILKSIGSDEDAKIDAKLGKGDERWQVILEIPEAPEPRYESIKCIVKTIPPEPDSFDKPARYELVIDRKYGIAGIGTGISAFELLGDYDEIAKKSKIDAAVNELMISCNILPRI